MNLLFGNVLAIKIKNYTKQIGSENGINLFIVQNVLIKTTIVFGSLKSK